MFDIFNEILSAIIMRNINYSSKIVNKIGPNFVATKDRKKSFLKQKIK
jgi:hypothetical protein